MNPNNQVYYQSSGGGNSKKRWLIIIGLVVLAVISLALAALTTNGGNNNAGSGDEQQQSGAQDSDNAPTFQITDLRSPGFQPPKDMKGFNRDFDYAYDIHDYTASDNSCNLQFGIAPSVDLPGNTLAEIASAHLGASTQAGAVSETPKTGKDLKLRSVDGSSIYTMPTLDFTYARDNVNYKASYSAVILPEGRKAYVRRYCSNTDAPVPNASMQKINKKASEIRVVEE